MTNFRSHKRNRLFRRSLVACRTLGPALLCLLLTAGMRGQDPGQGPGQDAGAAKEAGGYAIHQSADLGGRAVDSSGSGAMYDTLVNLDSGPRILSDTLDLHALANTNHRFVDDLAWSNSGYGGDPYDVSTLRMEKGALYKFQGMFRRDRQYFDYNLLGNPLVPAGLTSNGYTFPQVENAPHLFNTVRRMTDVNLTLLPLSKMSFRTGYSHNTDEGPSYSSQHNGADVLFLQNWRNSTDTWLGGADWKPAAKTMLTFEETVTHYKGDTNWQLAGQNLQLANGMPVALSFDNVVVPKCGDGNPPIVSSATTPPTVNPTCSGFLHYSRTEPTRTLIPTEQFRFQSAAIKNVRMNGDVRYTGATMNLPDYVEFFNGNDRGTRSFTTTGLAKGQRIDVSADYGISWEITDKVSVSDQFDFLDFRQPAVSLLTEVDILGTSLLAPLGAPEPPVVTLAPTFLGMKTESNTATLTWDPVSKASVSLGYRYQQRFISWVMPLPTDALLNGTSYTFPIHENAGILGLVLHPAREWRINAKLEASYDDQAYTQISPRQLYHYYLQTRYKPREWASIFGTFNDLEGRNNAALVNHLDHSRSLSLGADLMPSPRYGLDLEYGYGDIFSRTTLCYASTPAPVGPGAGAAPADCGTNLNLGTGYYDAPTQYGSFGFTLAPVKKLRTNAGYRISAVDGTTEFLNPMQVSGSLRSKYQTPYADVAWTLRPGLVAKGGWNHYEYGEEGPVGPTSPRNFRAEVLTVALHYEF